jgi:hypothetical protein
MSEENPGAHQAHHRCNRPNHHELPLRPGKHQTTAALHSQKDSFVWIEDPAE